MKIFITGIEGYIGTRLAGVLVEAGHEVAGLDAGFYAEGHLYDEAEKHTVNIIKKDIRLVEASDLEGFDAVVHLAELSNDPLGENDPELTREINHKGTMRLAEAAKKAGVKRFIYSSSCSVYGASDDVADEDSITQPLTTYAQCKILNEKFLLHMADQDFTPVILRNATVFGPSERMRFDLAVNNLSGVAWTTGEIKMESDGTPWRPFVHILDVCEAIKAALAAPKETVQGQIFNVGSTDSNYQIKEIANIISRELPECKVTFNPNAPDKRNYRVNFDKIASKLPGFSASRSVEDGVRELLAIFKDIKMNKEIFESRLYTRLKQIKHLRELNRIDDKFYFKEGV